MMVALQTWMLRHVQTALGTLGRLAQHWTATTLMVLVIGIALALPACLYVLLDNARLASGGWNRAVEISIYFKSGTALTDVERTADLIRRRSDVNQVRLISATMALEEFRRQSGVGAALEALGENPLPHALIVRPAAEATDGPALQELASQLGRLPGIELVRLDAQWVERFNAILATISRGLTFLAVLLAIGVWVIVGNAIRADILLRRDEIEVTKLVGGSDAFVRRPFLYAGTFYGLAGGLLALIITWTAVATLGGPVRRLATLYGSSFELQGLDWSESLKLLGIAVALGWLGSYFSATRHILRIEPR